jgi:hypothetical protein
MQTSPIVWLRCACGEEITHATNLRGEGLPKAGDLAVCSYCGELYEFQGGEQLGIRPLRLEVLQGEHPATAAEVFRIRAAIRAARRQ